MIREGSGEADQPSRSSTSKIGLFAAMAIGIGGMIGARVVGGSEVFIVIVKLIILGLFAALLSTASAINATLYGAANVSYIIARDGELPLAFSWKFRLNVTGGLFITAGLVMLFILFFDISDLAMMGSGAFLLIYACVHAAHLKVTAKPEETNPSLYLRWLHASQCSQFCRCTSTRTAGQT